jgi:TetR/AcrR family transcriptional regulator, hemagglutinin/protease regulatory protein
MKAAGMAGSVLPLNRSEPCARRRLPPAARRARLLACALRVFAQWGIGAARHAEIAAEAGVSVPTVFVYFPTRAALVDAVLAEVARFYIALAEDVHASRRPAPEVVTAHAMAFTRSVDNHPDYASVLLNWSSAVRTEHWPRYRAMETRVVALLARIIELTEKLGWTHVTFNRDIVGDNFHVLCAPAAYRPCHHAAGHLHGDLSAFVQQPDTATPGCRGLSPRKETRRGTGRKMLPRCSARGMPRGSAQRGATPGQEQRRGGATRRHSFGKGCI